MSKLNEIASALANFTRWEETPTADWQALRLGDDLMLKIVQRGHRKGVPMYEIRLGIEVLGKTTVRSPIGRKRIAHGLFRQWMQRATDTLNAAEGGEL